MWVEPQRTSNPGIVEELRCVDVRPLPAGGTQLVSYLVVYLAHFRGVIASCVWALARQATPNRPIWLLHSLSRKSTSTSWLVGHVWFIICACIGRTQQCMLESSNKMTSAAKFLPVAGPKTPVPAAAGAASPCYWPRSAATVNCG